MEYAAIVAAVAGLIGGLVSIGKDAEAQALRQRMADQFGPGILPHLDQAVAQHVQSAAPSAANDTGRSAQVDTLRELENEYQSGGMTRGDQAAYDVAGRKVSQRAASDAGNISADLARRGQTGSALGGVMASQSGQDSLEALAGLEAEAASAGRGRAMSALQAKMGGAGALREGDLSVANATDTMNRFNAAGDMAAQMHNLAIPQQNFENTMAQRGAQNNALNGVAAGLDAQGNAIRQTAGGIGNAALSYGQAADWAQDPSNPKNKKAG